MKHCHGLLSHQAWQNSASNSRQHPSLPHWPEYFSTFLTPFSSPPSLLSRVWCNHPNTIPISTRAFRFPVRTTLRPTRLGPKASNIKRYGFFESCEGLVLSSNMFKCTRSSSFHFFCSAFQPTIRTSSGFYAGFVQQSDPARKDYVMTRLKFNSCKWFAAITTSAGARPQIPIHQPVWLQRAFGTQNILRLWDRRISLRHPLPKYLQEKICKHEFSRINDSCTCVAYLKSSSIASNREHSERQHESWMSRVCRLRKCIKHASNRDLWKSKHHMLAPVNAKSAINDLQEKFILGVTALALVLVSILLRPNWISCFSNGTLTAPRSPRA